jgi:Arc/MetJ-type ribon-helix-helix transcriptional regulator
VQLEAAPAPPRVDLVRDDHDVAGMGDFAELEAHLIECLVPAPPGLSDSVGPARDAPVAPQPRMVLPDDVAVVGRVDGGGVAPPIGLPDGADDVDVLLGHGGMVPLWYHNGMSKQIAVRLPDELVDFVDEVVASGTERSRAAVVSRALERERRRAVAARDAEILARTGPDPELAGLADHIAGLPSELD